MRGSGKTTRKIDEAIQILFKYGEIILPSKKEIEDGTYYRGYSNQEIFIIDPDYHYGTRVQHDLMHRIVQRLAIEHPQLKFDIKNKSHLRLKTSQVVLHDRS